VADRDIDGQLVARAQRGDKRAFELLVEKYQRKLARLLSRFVRDPAEVEDVTRRQESLKEAGEALKQLDSETMKSPETARQLDAQASEQAALSQKMSQIAAQTADVVLFVVDARVGSTDVDEAAVRMLRRSATPVILVANKIDDQRLEPEVASLWSLGLGEPVSVSALHGRGSGDLLDRVIETFPRRAERPAPGPRGPRRVALVGRPNVGKSSLLNALLGDNRMIVSEIPGTTRDALQAEVQLGGYPFRLVDTAGLRETDDQVERLGVEVARRHLGRADVVLLCVESGGGPGEAERSFLRELGPVPVVLVYTKCDLDPHERPEEGTSVPGVAATVRLSVVSGEGLEALRSVLPRLVYSGLVELGPGAPVLTRRRHARSLAAAREAVDAFRSALQEGVPPEMAGTHLRSAETALEELLGVISVEDVLDAVFGEFCIGK